MNLPRELTTVTSLSKVLSLFLFITFPIVSFLFGMKYESLIYSNKSINSYTTSLPGINQKSANTLPPLYSKIKWGNESKTDSIFYKPNGQTISVLGTYRTTTEQFTGEPDSYINYYKDWFASRKWILTATVGPGPATGHYFYEYYNNDKYFRFGVIYDKSYTHYTPFIEHN